MLYAGIDQEEKTKKKHPPKGFRTQVRNRQDRDGKRQRDLMNSTTISDLDSSQSNKSIEVRSYSLNSRTNSLNQERRTLYGGSTAKQKNQLKDRTSRADEKTERNNPLDASADKISLSRCEIKEAPNKYHRSVAQGKLQAISLTAGFKVGQRVQTGSSGQRDQLLKV